MKKGIKTNRKQIIDYLAEQEKVRIDHFVIFDKQRGKIIEVTYKERQWHG